MIRQSKDSTADVIATAAAQGTAQEPWNGIPWGQHGQSAFVVASTPGQSPADMAADTLAKAGDTGSKAS